MNKKELLAGATFLTLYTGFIFTGFSWMLSSKISPLEKRMDQIESEITPIKEEIAFIKAETALIKAETALIKENQARLETRMDRMEIEQKDIKERIIRIESMLGQILIAQNLHHKGKTKPVGKFKKPSTAKPVQRKTASQ